MLSFIVKYFTDFNTFKYFPLTRNSLEIDSESQGGASKLFVNINNSFSLLFTVGND